MDDDYIPGVWWLLLVCPTHCVDGRLTSRNVWALEAVLKDFPNAGELIRLASRIELIHVRDFFDVRSVPLCHSTNCFLPASFPKSRRKIDLDPTYTKARSTHGEMAGPGRPLSGCQSE
jgi:hypothetical protein